MSQTNAEFKRKRPRSQARAAVDPLLASWEKTLRDNRDRPALLDGTGAVACTFSQIEKRARAFNEELEGLGPGQVVAIQIGNHPAWPWLFLACLRRRLVVLPLEQSISKEQQKAAFDICGVAAVIVARDTKTAKVRSLKNAGEATIEWQKKQPVLLKLTSGTTAAPRAIRFRSQQLLADCENICDTMDISSRDLNFGVIPISHSYGFSNLLTPLLARAVPMVLSTDRIPRAILEDVCATGATVFPGMPVFYQSLSELPEGVRLTRLRTCISAGAPLPPEVANKFRHKFGCAIHSFYGSSECGGICYARESRSEPGFVGQPMERVTIEPLEEGTASIIRVRSEAVADGYFPTRDETKLGRGFFMPDDLLEQTPAGYRLVGRVSDLINVAGKKVNPVAIETVLLRCPGVHAAIVFGRESARRNQEIAACVVSRIGVGEPDLIAHCRAHLTSWQVPRRIYFVDGIPVNERGKTSRRELAGRYPSGS